MDVFLLLLVFVAFDRITAPSQSTATAILEAVNKKQLLPLALVEVASAIRSSTFLGLVLRTIAVLSVFALSSDLWLLVWFRREKPSTVATTHQQ